MDGASRESSCSEGCVGVREKVDRLTSPPARPHARGGSRRPVTLLAEHIPTASTIYFTLLIRFFCQLERCIVCFPAHGGFPMYSPFLWGAQMLKNNGTTHWLHVFGSEMNVIFVRPRKAKLPEPSSSGCRLQAAAKSSLYSSVNMRYMVTLTLT
jgi:hypothetical protein